MTPEARGQQLPVAHLDAVRQRVADVKSASHVWWRDDHHELGFTAPILRSEEPALLPPAIPRSLHQLRVITLSHLTRGVLLRPCRRCERSFKQCCVRSSCFSSVVALGRLLRLVLRRKQANQHSQIAHREGCRPSPYAPFSSPLLPRKPSSSRPLSRLLLPPSQLWPWPVRGARCSD
jgi:hypothetical protein